IDTSGGSPATTYKGWAKWYYATSTAGLETTTTDNSIARDGVRSWVLIGDESSFYVLPSISSVDFAVSENSYPYGFGITEKKGSYYPFLSASTTYLPANGSARTTSSIGLSSNLANFIQILKDASGNINPSTAMIHVSGTTSSSVNS